MYRYPLYTIPKKVFAQTLIILMFTLLFVNILCLNANMISASGDEVGVKIGDWITYEINYTENTPPVYPLYTRREIMDVRGTVLTINTTYLLSDETVSSSTSDGDVAYSNGSCAMIFIPANLGVGDRVYIQGFEDADIRISDETTMTFLGVARTVIYAQFSSHGFDIAVFWDKQKGTALEIYGVGTYTSISQVIGTNMWSSNSAPTAGLEPIIFIIIMIILALILVFGYISSQRNARKRAKKP
jgi:hypothetical protein